MEPMNIFARAAKMKLRFDTRNGRINVEDLWDLPLSKLDTIAIDLYDVLQKAPTRSFVTNAVSETNALVQMQFDIVKFIIDHKLADAKAAEQAAATRAKKQRIMELIEEKKDQSLANMEVNELEELLNSM